MSCKYGVFRLESRHYIKQEKRDIPKQVCPSLSGPSSIRHQKHGIYLQSKALGVFLWGNGQAVIILTAPMAYHYDTAVDELLQAIIDAMEHNVRMWGGHAVSGRNGAQVRPYNMQGQFK